MNYLNSLKIGRLLNSHLMLSVLVTILVTTVSFFSRAQSVKIVEEDRTEPQTLVEIYNQNYRDDTTQMTHEGVISFINQRLSQESLNELEIEVQVRESLLNSEDYYLCVNNFLSGYPETPNEGRVKLDRTVEPVQVLSDAPIEEVENGVKDIYWRIRYGGEDYWGKRGYETSDGRKEYFISTYKNCPKIQEDIFKVALENRLREIQEEKENEQAQTGFSLPEESSGFTEYVCTQDSPLNAYETKSDVESGDSALKLPKSTQVVQVQGQDQDPFEAQNGHTYVYVQVQPDFEREEPLEYANKRFWVAKDFVKTFEDCASVQTDVAMVCSENPVRVYETDNELAAQDSRVQVGEFMPIYRRYGEYHSKKIILNRQGQEEIYVPVSYERNSDEILWIEEDKVPLDCPLNPEKRITYRSVINGERCEVSANDNFPLEHAARFNYYTGSAKYEAGRIGTSRVHGGVDLYSYYRWGRGSRNDYGGEVTSINKGKVVGISTWKHTHYIIIQSNVSDESWLYGEVGDVTVRDQQAVYRQHRLAKTEQYVTNNSKYPAMVHMEKYTRHLSNASSYRGGGNKRRHSSNTDPSCNLEYASRTKFNQVWEGE